MNRWRKIDSPRTRLLGWASMVVPVLVFLFLLQGPGLGLAKLNLQRRTELAAWNSNVYENDWLDSSQRSLLQNRDFLAGLNEKVESRLLPDSLAGGAMVDSLRRAAQSFGCEVVSLSPSRDSSGNLNRLRLRMEIRSDFASAMRWFQALAKSRPEAYVEEALLRPEARGKLAINLTLLFHSRMTR